MQTVLYGQDKEYVDARFQVVHNPDKETGPLKPEMFYPVVTVQEMEIWEHWLPTQILYNPSNIEYDLLEKLNAPDEVMGELLWAQKLDLFEEYMLRTPERVDSKDPLLLGRQGANWYRIALWGESLLPFEQITTLVQQSLVIRKRKMTWHIVRSLCGPVVGFLLGMWFNANAHTPSVYEYSYSGSLVLTFAGFIFGWFPGHAISPLNHQQDFLDRYRS